ncbi:hypothetical protein T08_15828, partial [Trichinella sp. T8]
LVGLLHENVTAECKGFVYEMPCLGAGRLEVAVETFDDAVSLWMVGGGGDVLAAEHFVECGPCVRAELPASISGYTARNAKTRDPVGQEGSNHRRCRYVMNRPRFRPPVALRCPDVRARNGARVGGIPLAVSACAAVFWHVHCRDTCCRASTETSSGGLEHVPAASASSVSSIREMGLATTHGPEAGSIAPAVLGERGGVAASPGDSSGLDAVLDKVRSTWVGLTAQHGLPALNESPLPMSSFPSVVFPALASQEFSLTNAQPMLGRSFGAGFCLTSTLEQSVNLFAIYLFV